MLMDICDKAFFLVQAKKNKNKDTSNIIIENPLTKEDLYFDEHSEHWIYKNDSYEFYVSSRFNTFLIYDKKLDKHFGGSLIFDEDVLIDYTCKCEFPKEFCTMLELLGFKISETIKNVSCSRSSI